MRISVGSENPIKVEAVEKSFRLFFTDIVVESLAVKSIPQPIGYNETIRYAVLRGLQAVSSGDYDYGVGIEAGLIKMPWSITGYMDKHICAIVDRRHLVTIGVSMGFELPIKVIYGVFSRKCVESEEIVEKISGIRNIGNSIGAVGYLTKQKVLRIDLCIQSVLSALIPRINTSHYNDKWPTAEEILSTCHGVDEGSL